MQPNSSINQNLKVHRNTAIAVVEALELIFNERRYADKVLEKVLKQNSRWGARDRRFIAETTYDIVRWHRLYKELSGAAAGDFWTLLAVWCVINRIPLPQWPEVENIDPAKILQKDIGMFPRSVQSSIPDWLDELGAKELGEERWSSEISALNLPAEVVLRVNTLKTDKANLRKTLADEDVAVDLLVGFPDALVLRQRQNIFGSPSFKSGLFEVQDAGSQLIAPFLEAAPGDRVIDACAGAGGKTLHLAALLKNKGRIIALDTEGWKLEELQKRARRAGVSNVECRIIESGKTIKRLSGKADRLLLDVPCSGLGVLKRNPDAKWKLTPDFIQRVRELQAHILHDYCEMVKPGGLIVYSTCSILPSENELQVSAFVNANTEKYQMIRQKHVWPSEGFDGFYMALIKRL